jgi:hypothetical protein
MSGLTSAGRSTRAIHGPATSAAENREDFLAQQHPSELDRDAFVLW